MKHTDPEYGKQMRPRSSSNDSRAGAKETVAVCKREGCEKAQADAPTQWNKGYCSNGCAKTAKKAKGKDEEATDKSSSASPRGSPKVKGVLKKTEHVQHTAEPSSPQQSHLLLRQTICSASTQRCMKRWGMLFKFKFQTSPTSETTS